MGGAGVGGERGLGGRAVAGGALLSPRKPLLMLLGPM